MYFLIITTIVTGVSFSRYASGQSSYDTARVAKFNVVVAPNSWSDEDVTLLKPADPTSKVYGYTITNNSEVAVRVRIVIDSASAGNTTVTVFPAGWFDLAANGGFRNDVTVTVAGVFGGNRVEMSVEYEQID